MVYDILNNFLYYSLTKEDVVMGMLKNFEMAKDDETAQEKWKMARKLKRQVGNDSSSRFCSHGTTNCEVILVVFVLMFYGLIKMFCRKS